MAVVNRAVRNEVSPEEWLARVDLAACYRLVHHFGMSDMIYNHISLRVPGEDNHFLINPFGMMYSEITASSLLKVDLDGEILYNPCPDYSINLAGYIIHSAVHSARHDVACVIHTHTPDGIAVSALECGLLPVSQLAMRFIGNVAYHDYEGVSVNEDERSRLVANMGNADVMFLRNHGLLAVGSSIQEAFNNIYRLERACITQIKAMSCRTPLSLPPEETVSLAYRQLKVQPSTDPKIKKEPFGILEWPALLRMLDAHDSSYGE